MLVPSTLRRLPRSWTLYLAVLVSVSVLFSTPAAAEEPETGWKNSAELSFVAAEGNAETNTLGFGASFERLWDNRSWKTELSGLRADSTTTTRSASGTDTDFFILETSTTERTAEKYHLGTRFDKKLKTSAFWFTGASWDKNELAGIDQRLAAIAGLGKTFRDTETLRAAADLGLTFTHEEAVIDGVDDQDFLGLRAALELTRQLTETTSYDFKLEVHQNLDDTDDLRADMFHALKVAINERIALKVHLALAYDNQPALTEIPLTRPDGSTGTVLGELDELDSILTVAMVVDF